MRNGGVLFFPSFWGTIILKIVFICCKQSKNENIFACFKVWKNTGCWIDMYLDFVLLNMKNICRVMLLILSQLCTYISWKVNKKRNHLFKKNRIQSLILAVGKIILHTGCFIKAWFIIGIVTFPNSFEAVN